MTTQSIRVGVVGAGGNTRLHHIPKLQAIDGVEVVGVVNRNLESSERVAKEFDIPSTYANWKDLVNDDNLNAVVIGTWPYMHCSVTLAAIEAGKHIMCEARMAMNAAEAHSMLEAAQANPQLVTQIVPSPFTLGVDKTIKRLLSEGYLGNILAIEIRARPDSFLDREAPFHWRHNIDLSGFNIMSMGIWYEALMRWVGDATHLMAKGKTYVNMRTDNAGYKQSVRIPEHIDILADMACGAQAHIQISSVTGLGGVNEAILFGSEGTLRFTAGKLYGGRRGDDAIAEITIPAEEKGGWRVEEEFINAIRGQEVITHTTFEDGVKYMEFTEAVTLSMQSGQAISLPLL